MTAPSNSADGGMLNAHATEIETYTGQLLELQNPDPAAIDLLDIGHALSLTCRYGGHVNRFYSVAEHAVLVHDLLAWQGADEALRRAALFHDAAEAYLGDVIAPLKYALRRNDDGVVIQSDYDVLSGRMDAAIATRFDLDITDLDSYALRVADMWALRIEARELTCSGGANWRWPGELPNGGELPAGIEWGGGLAPERARRMWLGVADTLGIRPDQPEPDPSLHDGSRTFIRPEGLT